MWVHYLGQGHGRTQQSPDQRSTTPPLHPDWPWGALSTHVHVFVFLFQNIWASKNKLNLTKVCPQHRPDADFYSETDFSSNILSHHSNGAKLDSFKIKELQNSINFNVNQDFWSSYNSKPLVISTNPILLFMVIWKKENILWVFEMTDCFRSFFKPAYYRRWNTL